MDFLIRSVEPDDYLGIQQMFTEPKLIWGTLQLPFPSIEMWRKRLAEPSDGLHGLVACREDEIVGQLSLHTHPNSPRRRHAGDIGMAVREKWQGQGVGTALLRAATELADNWLNLTRLELTVYTDNEPAIRLYRKCGFVIEGTLRNYALRNAIFEDVYTMARLRDAQV